MKEQKIKSRGVMTNYVMGGHGEKPLVILHGWGGSSVSWHKVIKYLEEKIKIVCPDIPGFGKSEMPDPSWGLKEYVEWLKDFLEKLGYKNLFLLGHSFGGRIAIKFAISYPERIQHLILLNSAGIKQKWGIKERVLFWVAVTANAILAKGWGVRFKDKMRHIFYQIFRDLDYGKASERMRRVMKNVIDEDLFPSLPQIAVGTTILWGEKDNVVPVKYAYIFKEHIKNSRLEILPHLKHSPHLEDPERLSEKIYELLLTKNINGNH